MKRNYYPGCTLKTKAAQLDANARAAAEALGVTLEELPEWQCCGAVYPLARDEIASKLSAVRALEAARSNGGELITRCSACHHVLKRVNDDMANDPDINLRANNYSAFATRYSGETKVVHYLEMLRDTIGFDEIAKRVKKPLNGKKVAAYYGCMLLRPSDVMDFDRPDNPQIMEDLIKALGGEPVPFTKRSQCCGGYTTLGNKKLAQEMTEAVLGVAKADGAEIVITACPLCLYNLNTNATESKLPIIYFTEVLADALDVRQDADAALALAGRECACTE